MSSNESGFHFVELVFGGMGGVPHDIDPTDRIKIITLIINERMLIL
jgi:hypothetical protein